MASSALSEVDQPAARLRDLSLLAALARVRALVVAAEQQNEAVAVHVAEDAQQDALPLRLVAGGLATRSQDLAGVIAEPQLEEAVAALLAVGAAQTPMPLTSKISRSATPIARRCVGVSSSRSHRSPGWSPSATS